jgi:hypothetical protein
MEKMCRLFADFILKAIVMTENIIALPVDEEKLESFTSNRERLFLVIDGLSKQIDWSAVSQDQREELDRQIDYIKKLDEKLVVKLQEHQMEMKKDIETTHRQNESLKGYNLNDLK